jgi:polyvinyl alcohol dehydrogenase (cytochrome)
MLSKTISSLFFLILGFYFGLSSSAFASKSIDFSLHSPPTGKEIYQSKCAFCHNGTVKESPRFEALQLLSSDAIKLALTSGVMKVQGTTLSEEERNAVANFISKIDTKSQKTIAGLCDDAKVFSNAKPIISNWGMGLTNQRFIPENLAKINSKNIQNLKLKWAFAFPEATRARTQPTVAGNTLFTASQHGVIYAIDTRTGCIRWTFKADSEVRSAISIGTDNNGNANRIYFGDFNAYIYAIDLQTHSLIWKKKIDNHAQATITGSMVEFQNRLYIPVSSTEVVSAYSQKYECCTFRGSVVALDAATGSEIWKTYTISEEPKPNGTTTAGKQIFAPSGAPVWGSPTIDTKRGCLYIGTGENYTRPSTTTSDAIISMSLETGKIQWVQQTLGQDSWNGACTTPDGANCPPNHGPDFDFGAPPILISRKNKPDMILAGQKSGMVYAMNPDKNGAIVWQARVGRGGIMGGIHWGMASDEETLFVPINDRDVWPEDKDKPAFSGLHAIDIESGKFHWSKIQENTCGDANWTCGPGLSAAITLCNNIVWGASLDGIIHAFSTKQGQILWEYDTKQEFQAVNGIKANGGTIDSAGTIVVGNQVFINSGYAKFGEKSGNVLLCFELQ